MTHTFTDALNVVLHEEGGFVNNPRDPGGMTNLGVTADTWHQWTGRPINEVTMRSLTPDAVAPLYKAWYWDKIDGDNLPVGLALVVFDFAVNAGPGRAAKTLQGIVGAAEDGAIGPGTLRAIQAFITAHGLAELITRFSDARANYYRSLPTFATFGKGWLARVGRVETYALGWV